jgi:signal transduction histidine kinase
MMKDTHRDRIAFTIKNSVAGQVVVLMFWPLLTVILVVGALYYDRVRDLEVNAAQKEMLLLRTAGQLLSSGSASVVSNMYTLAESEALTRSLREVNPASFSRLSALFRATTNKDSSYSKIQLLSEDGTILVSVPEQGSGANTLPGSLEPEEQENSISAFLGQPGGIVCCFPVVLRISIDNQDDPSAPLLRFAMVLEEQQGGRGGLLVFDYKLSALRDAIEALGVRETGELYILDPERYLQHLSENKHGVPESSTSKSDLIEISDTSSDLLPVLVAIRKQEKPPLFHGGNLYTFTSFNLFSEKYPSDNRQVTDSNQAGVLTAVSHPWLLISMIPASYFSTQKKSYSRFLLVLAAALLVPSIVVCVFLAKTRLRVYQEAASRYRQQVVHLEELEDKVKLRTRELDDQNLRLSGEIAERLTAENQLKQSNELLSGMLQSLDGMIYVADFDSYEILFANDYLKNLFGFDPVGKKCWQFIHSSKDGPCIFCTNNELLDPLGEPTGPYQWEYQNPFNKKWYAAKDQAIRWSNGKYVKLEIAIDITEQKRLEHFLTEARRQAELAQGIRSRFVALVAHDLKSPFFSITQMLNRILERETFTHKIHRQFLENIVENGKQMLLMIDNLLSMDRFESSGVKLEKTFFDVSEMAAEVLQNFDHLAFEKGVRLENYIPADTSVYADKYLYFVVLNNLLSNAIKFSVRGGTIELFRPDPSRSTTIAVRDNGKGMSLDYARNLFKADVKTSSRGTKGEKGTGLGLIFCQDILKAHQGLIEVESERGVGTTFRISLPEVCQTADGDRPVIEDDSAS